MFYGKSRAKCDKKSEKKKNVKSVIFKAKYWNEVSKYYTVW